MRYRNRLIWVKGAGDLGTGVAFRLLEAGFPVFLSDLAEPICVRRTVCFAEAIATGRHTVEGYSAIRVGSAAEVRTALDQELVPVAADPEGHLGRLLNPLAMVDAVVAKRNTGTRIKDAPVVIALGPGFVAGVDCDAIVETNRGHSLGRVLYSGSAEPDTGVPGAMGGVTNSRVIRAPAAGFFEGLADIGAQLHPGEQVGQVRTKDGIALPVTASVGGVLRGLIRSGVWVTSGLKIGDVDPSGEQQRCYTISDKSLAIGGGVLTAVLKLSRILAAQASTV